MRIISGISRGRKIKAVPGMNTRPTSDRVKEAVFNVLGQRILECEFLDVFGGSGNIALEAVSRGASRAITIEKNATAFKIINENIKLCGFEQSIKPLKMDSIMALKKLGQEKQSFDIIYLDPPYQGGLYQKVIELIDEYRLLRKDGILVVESSKNTSLIAESSLLLNNRESYYGDTKINYYQYKHNE